MKYSSFVEIVSILSLLAFCNLGFSQTAKPLSFKENFWTGFEIYEGDTKLRRPNIPIKLSSSPEAVQYYKKGKSLNTQACILAIIGGAGTVWGVGSLKNPNRDGGGVMLGAGLAVIVGGLIVWKNAKKNYNKAIDTYNSDMSLGARDVPKENYSLSIVSSANGIGLSITF